MAGSDSINVLSWRGHSSRPVVLTALGLFVLAAVTVVALGTHADAATTHHSQQYAVLTAAALTFLFLHLASALKVTFIHVFMR